MKKLALTVLLLLLATALFVGCQQHEHLWSDWSWETTPSAVEGGVAVRSCQCGQKQKVSVAPVTDSSVWSSNPEVPSTHDTEGYREYFCQYGSVTITFAKGTHLYRWTVQTQPTFDQTGLAVGQCDCGGTIQRVLPILTDPTWTEDVAEHKDSTCTKQGSAVYVCDICQVSVALPPASHTWSNWSLTQKPSGSTTGTAVHTCSVCSEQQDITVPVLTDSVWQKQTVSPANYLSPQIVKYTSVYGEVTVEEGDKLVAPYENKTYNYYTYNLDSGFLQNTDEIFVVDNLGNATSQNLAATFSLLQSGVSVTVDGTTLDGSVDGDGNVFVFGNGIAWLFVQSNAICACKLGNGVAVTYGNKALFYNGNILFNVKLVAKTTQVQQVTNCTGATAVAVVNLNGETVAAFRLQDDQFVSAQQLSVFAVGESWLMIDGNKVLNFNDATLSGNDIFVYENEKVVEYYFATFNQTSHTATVTKPTATVKYLLVGVQAQDVVEVSDDIFNLNVENSLKQITIDGYAFLGYFADESCTQPLQSNLTLTADKTVYVKFTNSFTVTAVSNGQSTTHTFAVGANAQLVDPQREGFVFDGWYTSDQFLPQTLWQGGQLTADVTVYAKWSAAHSLAGNYTCWEILRGEVIGTGKASTIDGRGKLTILNYPQGTVSLDGTSLSVSNINQQGVVHQPSGVFVLLDATNGAKDIFLFVPGAYTSATPQFWDTNNSVGIVSITDGDATQNIFVDCVSLKVFGNVQLSSTDVLQTLQSGQRLTVTAEQTFVFAKVGDDVLRDDGLVGTYSGALGTISLDGFGTLTAGTTTSYTQKGNAILFVLKSRQYAVALQGSTYTQTTDGYQGEYDADGTKIVLDGYGCVQSSTDTYFVEGNILTVVGESTSVYQMDGKTLVLQSSPEGSTFSGTYYSQEEMDDIQMSVTFNTKTTATLTVEDGNWFCFDVSGQNQLTLTVTSSSLDVQGTVTVTVANGTLTVVEQNLVFDSPDLAFVYSFTDALLYAE